MAAVIIDLLHLGEGIMAVDIIHRHEATINNNDMSRMEEEEKVMVNHRHFDSLKDIQAEIKVVKMDTQVVIMDTQVVIKVVEVMKDVMTVVEAVIQAAATVVKVEETIEAMEIQEEVPEWETIVAYIVMIVVRNVEEMKNVVVAEVVAEEVVEVVEDLARNVQEMEWMDENRK
jgi:hypothetical protein